MSAAVHLRVIRNEPESGERQVADPDAVPDRGDLVLLAFLFLLNLVPVAGELGGVGRWSPAVVGFAAGALLLTGRELWTQLRARWRRHTHRTRHP
jgi:hypothetical protein